MRNTRRQTDDKLQIPDRIGRDKVLRLAETAGAEHDPGKAGERFVGDVRERD